MNRRDLIKSGAVTTAAIAMGGFQVACAPKNLSGWVTTIIASFGEIKPLLPQLGLSQAVIDRVSGWIEKAVHIAQEFDAAYKAGKFSDAMTLFTNLGGLITQVASELNVVNNRIINLLLVGIQIARITIASLLKTQGENQPQIARRSMSRSEQDAANEIQRLAAIDVSGLLKAIQ